MYRVRLQDFEGPLDLLLFFIQRDELDIYDIPIAHIADEFLAYVRVMEQVDLDGVGDFIYMAAVLINIKARMLLPSPEVDDAGEVIDPRRELVERLLEYVRFKEAAQLLDERFEARGLLFDRVPAAPDEQEASGSVVLEQASIFDLISALRRILTQAPEVPSHAVERFEYTVEQQQAYVLRQLGLQPDWSFRALVKGESKPFVIATFLAVLELARQQQVLVRIGHRVEDFTVSKVVPEAATRPSAETNGQAV